MTTTDHAAELDRLRAILEKVECLRFQIRDTPLNSIIGYSGMMLDEQFGPLSAEYRDCADNIRAYGEMIYKMIMEMRELILDAFPQYRERPLNPPPPKDNG